MAEPTFADVFGRRPLVTTDAPGRVNLIGEHTDYSGGFVLPIAIPQRTQVEASPRQDRVVRLWSAQFADAPVVEYELGCEARDGAWTDYVKGMTRVLASRGTLGGFEARVSSDVPVGSGLSSSAALEIAIGRALRDMFGLALDDVALAVAAQQAENEFVGAPVGIMDQMAASLADTHAALFLDTRSLDYERVPLPAGCALIVIDSGIVHRHADGEYAVRRRECAEAAAALGVGELRDVTPARLGDVERLGPPLDRRARHVVTENQRVIETVAAFRAGDVRAVGRLFVASHVSMRDDFEVSVAPVDELVEHARRVQDVYGARLTGGGFGGSIVALAAAGSARRAAQEIVSQYRSATGRTAAVLVPA